MLAYTIGSSPFSTRILARTTQRRTSIAICVDLWEISTTKLSKALDRDGLVTRRWLTCAYVRSKFYGFCCVRDHHMKPHTSRRSWVSSSLRRLVR